MQHLCYDAEPLIGKIALIEADHPDYWAQMQRRSLTGV